MSIFKDILLTLRDGLVVATRISQTRKLPVPNIGTGAAYAAGDAFGTSFEIPVPKEGVITSLVFLDYDDEGINKDLVLFSRPFTETADNSAFAVADNDLAYCLGVVSVDSWHDFANNQVGIGSQPLGYVAPHGVLWGQWVTQGADNIAAGAVPDFFMVVT